MRLLKSSLIKKILGFALIMGLSGIFLNGYVGTDGTVNVGVGEQVHAQQGNGDANGTNTGSQAISTMSMRQILNMVLKIIYLLLWPLLVVAGLALDNTLVYASIFHLDAPLWKFWNMMKNFANFTLGFMVLFAIIKSILSNSGEGSVKDEKSPLGIIKTTLIAGIFIQASWFLVAALVDVSTIATYAVGGLPLSVLKNTEMGKQKILSVNSSIDLNKFDIISAGGEDFQVWNSVTSNSVDKNIDPTQTVRISPCRVEHSYVVGREYGDIKYRNSDKLLAPFAGLEICTLYGNQLVMWPEDKFFGLLFDKIKTTYNTGDKSAYNKAITALIQLTGWDTTPLPFVKDNLVNLASGDKVSGFLTGNDFFSGSNALSISDIVKKSKGFVGPLVTMYSSLLNFTQLTSASVTTVSGTTGIFIIKALVAIALFFPLLALALVLILRIGVLWLYIVASPFIILKESFKNFIKMESLDKYLSVKSVIGIIFAPVVTVAALSISLIFMTALVNGFKSSSTNTAIYQTLGTQKIKAISTGNDAVSFEGVASLEFSKLPWGEAMDRFSWLMVNFFAIGLMRMIFFAAIKSNELGKSVGGKVESFGSNVFRTLPILPIGKDGKGVGVGSMGKVLNRVPDTYISNLNQAQEEQVRTWLGEEPTGGKGGTTANILTTSEVENIMKAPATKGNLTAAIVKEKGVAETNVGAYITGSEKIFFEKVKALPEGTEKENWKKAIADVGGNASWYDNMIKAEATTELEKVIKITSKDANVADLNKKVNDVSNKKIMDVFFAAEPNGYTKDIDGIKFTITKNENKYLVKSETIPTK